MVYGLKSTKPCQHYTPKQLHQSHQYLMIILYHYMQLMRVSYSPVCDIVAFFDAIRAVDLAL